jgi:hypothetical protein
MIPKSWKEVNYQEFIQELLKLPEREAVSRIDTRFNWKNYGIEFLKKLSFEAFIDSLINPKLIFIYQYCDWKINREQRNVDTSKILRSWQLWLVAIGTGIAGLYYLIEILKKFLC